MNDELDNFVTKAERIGKEDVRKSRRKNRCAKQSEQDLMG